MCCPLGGSCGAVVWIQAWADCRHRIGIGSLRATVYLPLEKKDSSRFLFLVYFVAHHLEKQIYCCTHALA